MLADKIKPRGAATQRGGGGRSCCGDTAQDQHNHTTLQHLTSSPSYDWQSPLLTPLHAALAYAAHGLRLFPAWWMREDGRCACGKQDCYSPGKHPIGKVAPHGFKDATDDLATIRAWWMRYPKANICWALPPDVVVVDEDPRNGGDLLDLPLTFQERLTRTSMTGGGGRHLLYRVDPPSDGEHYICGSIAPGIDVKTHGGYILLPPSNHKSGHRYQWSEELGPGDVAIAAAPPALLAILPYERTAPRTDRTYGPVSPDLSARLAWFLGELASDFNDTKRRGKVVCPFHGDGKPSLSYDLDRATWHCFGDGCPTGKGGGVREMAHFALEHFGLIEPRPKATGATEQEAGKATPRPAPPWTITAEDWHACPICSAWHHSARPAGGGLALRLHHRLCGKRDCTVSAKARAGDLLGDLDQWPVIHTATVATEDWPKLRIRLRRASARWLGIPTGAGILAVSDRPDGLPDPASTTDVQEIYTATVASVGRVRRPHEKTRTAVAEAIEEDQVASVTSFATASKAERLTMLSHELTHPEPPKEIEALARSLNVGGLPTEAHDRVKALWVKCGIVPDGNRATATIEQGQALLTELTVLRQEIAREVAREITLWGREVSSIGANRAEPLKDGAEPAGPEGPGEQLTEVAPGPLNRSIRR